MSEERLHDLLTSAVPDLPGPDDRVAAIGARVRRARLRTAGTVAGAALVAVALVLGVAQLTPPDSRPVPLASVPDIPVGTDGCPTSWPALPDSDEPGPLVPGGAVSVTLCELPVPAAGTHEANPPRTLRSHTDQVVNAFNALPTRAQEQARHPGAGRACGAVLYQTQPSYVFRYPGRPPVIVLVDQDCGTAYADGRTRVLDPADPGGRFLALYRAQLIADTDPATIASPTCPSGLLPAQVDPRTISAEPPDSIRRNQVGDEFLQSPLVAVVACRYVRHADGLVLTTSSGHRGGLEPVRDLLNAATTVQATTDANGTTSATNLTECGDPNHGDTTVTQLDEVHVVDATGATAVVRVWRAPCTAVFRFGQGGLVPTPALLTQLDAWLG